MRSAVTVGRLLAICRGTYPVVRGSPEGSTPAQRAQAAGYSSGFVGENIAAGYDTPEQVVDGWMKSPGHCLDIMEPRYRYPGVGYYYQSNAKMRSYWTQDFGG